MIEAVTATNQSEFLAYCQTWGPDHDESFVPKDIGPDKPSFVLREAGGVVGAAALLTGGSWKTSGRARFAVLHAGGPRPGSATQYAALVSACRQALGPEFRELSLFLPEAKAAEHEHLAALGFSAERTVFLMSRTADAPLPSAPGYQLLALTPGGADNARFLEVRNRNFREVLGSHDQTLADIEALFTDELAWAGGLNLLVDAQGRACGTFALEKDDEADSLFLGTIAVDRDRRGKGLGRYLVRSALDLARRGGFARVFLSVNALNAQATRLYLSEGFVVEKAMVGLVGPAHEGHSGS